MKIRKNYTLFINHSIKTAFYSGYIFNKRISKTPLGHIYDCSLNELKHNIKVLKKKRICCIQKKIIMKAIDLIKFFHG